MSTPASRDKKKRKEASVPGGRGVHGQSSIRPSSNGEGVDSASRSRGRERRKKGKRRRLVFLLKRKASGRCRLLMGIRRLASLGGVKKRKKKRKKSVSLGLQGLEGLRPLSMNKRKEVPHREREGLLLFRKRRLGGVIWSCWASSSIVPSGDGRGEGGDKFSSLRARKK